MALTDNIDGTTAKASSTSPESHKHTPGPWMSGILLRMTVSRSAKFNRAVSVIAFTDEMADLSKLKLTEEGQRQWEADSLLAAAAPDLLAACEAFERSWKSSGGVGGNVRELIRAAIAKAVGNE